MVQSQIIDAIVRDRAAAGDGYGRVTFVGHSFGAVLARKIAVAAFGEQFDREQPPGAVRTGTRTL